MVTIELTKEKYEILKSTYSEYFIPNSGEYIDFMAKFKTLVITGYLSKKEIRKVTFQGNGDLEEARLWDKTAKENKKKNIIKQSWKCFDDQIGSDEVGVGDFLLPIIVVASFVRASDIKDLKAFGVDDSKKLNDKDILEMGPKLIKRFFASKLTLTNEKYNELIAKGENLNSIKAKMHNRCLLNMIKKFPDTKNVFVDQFVKEETYYKYLNDKNEVIVGNITFRTKGESYYPCVALASVLARYSFLQEVDKLTKKYNMEIPKGASNYVNEFAKKFIAKYGKEEFDKIAKKNFANYNEAIS